MSTAVAQATEAPHEKPDLLANAKYVLTAASVEEQRMEKQHHIMKNVYPKPFPAEYVPQPTDRILESGAATGLWAIEAAALLPKTASIIGIDIHDRWFPSEKPSNVSFEVQSITDLPQEWTSSFNVVHQRFLGFALGLSDWKRAVSEMYRVLRPGGLIVLEEFETQFITPAKDPQDQEKQFPYLCKVEKYTEAVCKHKDLLFNAPDVLSEIIKQAGFSDVQVIVAERKFYGDALKEERENLVGIWLRLKDALVKSGANEGEMNKITEGFRQEMTDYEIGMPFFSFVARKP